MSWRTKRRLKVRHVQRQARRRLNFVFGVIDQGIANSDKSERAMAVWINISNSLHLRLRGRFQKCALEFVANTLCCSEASRSRWDFHDHHSSNVLRDHHNQLRRSKTDSS